MTEQLQTAALTYTPIQPVSGGALSLGDFLTHICSSWSGDLQGLAFATNGTWPVLGIDRKPSKDSQELSVAPVEGRSFDDKKVFELRLWVPVTHTDGPEDGTLLAREFRWVNGMSACEVILLMAQRDAEPSVQADETSSPTGCAHRVTYMQHDPRRGPVAEHTTPTPMSAIEYITEEATYGNMAVTDQLFTGKWN